MISTGNMEWDVTTHSNIGGKDRTFLVSIFSVDRTS
jgi:hypothetical protein